MRKILIIVAALIAPTLGWAAGGGATFPNDKIDIDWDDKAAMQRGARTYVNYCMSCHSAEYSRYNRVGADLGISDDLVRDNLIFTTDIHGEPTKVGELMKNTMKTCIRRRSVWCGAARSFPDRTFAWRKLVV